MVIGVVPGIRKTSVNSFFVERCGGGYTQNGEDYSRTKEGQCWENHHEGAAKGGRMFEEKTEGRPEIPALAMAMTKGEAVASTELAPFRR